MGDWVTYFRKTKRGEPWNRAEMARVVTVHKDDTPWYYTIRFEGGGNGGGGAGEEPDEMQTERHALTAVINPDDG